MNNIIENINGNLCITDNDEYLSSVLSDIARNNTAFPEITRLYEYKKSVRVEKTVKDENGKDTTIKERILKNALRVSFADGSWTEVVKSEEDENDPVTAVLYAIVKRLFGIPTESGYVCGNGFMSQLKKYAKSIVTEESEAEEKAKRIKEKEDSDKKAHEEAVKRREHHPSLGCRMNNLEKNLETLTNNLNALVEQMKANAPSK